MKILLLGSTGYAGSKFKEALQSKEWMFDTMPYAEVSVQSLLNKFMGTQFDAIINCAGYVGRPNVDAVENNREEAVQGNVLLPNILVEFGNIIKAVKILHISTGCCYESKDGEIFTEEDKPNLDWDSNTNCSFYAGTKSLGEKVIARFPQHYICRLRMPFDEKDSDRNYLSKLMSYDTLLSKSNSLSHLGDFVDACLQLLEKKCAFGIYNIVNTGPVTAKEVCSMLNEYDNFKKDFKFFDDEEDFYSRTGCNKRSNCILSNEKLLDAGVKMRLTTEAIKYSLDNWR
jgi:dTDP-4-dehydrorhamnose reductase